MILNRKSIRLRMIQQDIESQSKLADRLGVTRGAVSNWLRGGNISGDNAIALANVLKCGLDDIVKDYNDSPEVEAFD